jgi:hypothetical protein
MRLWSIHPKYLDPRGLVALWREGLLARKVLLGKTKGYKNHPQLERFKSQKNPVAALDVYLIYVYKESLRRGYAFDKSKINLNAKSLKINVSSGQIDYEFKHLLTKLKKRNRVQYLKMVEEKMIDSHPSFKIIEGNVEKWERMNRNEMQNEP